jgi:4-hydroxybenzoate polyprenyltransferase
VLVTATFVAIAARAAGSVPSAPHALRLAAVMLPIQFAIGAANDVADVDDDARAKPHKPIVRGVISRQEATLAALVLGAGGLVAAASINAPTLGLAAGGLAAGLAYDVGLRRTPLSWIPWWAGMALLPLAAYATASAFPSELYAVIPLALLVALSLHSANAMPDLVSDALAGQRSLPVLLGERRTRVLALGCLAAAVVLAAVVGLASGSGLRWAVVGVGGAVIVLIGVLAIAHPRRLFPPLAVATACFAVVWLAGIPS